MKTNRCHFIQVFFALFLFLVFPGSTQAETTNCTAITSVPYTISVPGIYCLTGNLETDMTSGSAITINVNNVVIDLNGRKLGGGSAGAGTNANGIFANNRKNITIKNGTIRGFKTGVFLNDTAANTISQGHIIQDIRADMNTHEGMYIAGRGNIIRNNQVVDTGGSTTTNYAYGITAVGPGSRVLNNDVYETKEQSTASASGIEIENGDGSVVMNNRVGNEAFTTTGDSYGIHIYSSYNVIVKSNTISKMEDGIYFVAGSTGLYADNLASGCTSPFVGGTAAGSTNYSN
jgi:parallel beta-helix repeat protein